MKKTLLSLIFSLFAFTSNSQIISVDVFEFQKRIVRCLDTTYEPEKMIFTEYDITFLYVIDSDTTYSEYESIYHSCWDTTYFKPYEFHGSYVFDLKQETVTSFVDGQTITKKLSRANLCDDVMTFIENDNPTFFWDINMIDKSITLGEAYDVNCSIEYHSTKSNFIIH